MKANRIARSLHSIRVFDSVVARLAAGVWLTAVSLPSPAADPAVGAVPPAPSPPPTTQPEAAPAPPAEPVPVDPAVRAMALKLGDDDPGVREGAAKKLTQMGKAALPALREAAGGEDPEARVRATDLIRHIEGHIPPPGPNPKAGRNTQSVSTSIVRGIKTVDVNDNGQKIHITAQPDGAIEMTVAGLEGGKEATETYKSKDAGELKRDNPEAFALYDKWAGNGGGVQVFSGPMIHGQIHIGPGGPVLVPPGAPGGGQGAPRSCRHRARTT